MVIRLKISEKYLNSLSLSLVLQCIARGTNYSTEIARELGYSQSAAVQNLKKLEMAGLIKSKPDGAAVKYSIVNEALANLWTEVVIKNEDEIYVPQRQENIFDTVTKNTANSIKDDHAFIEFTLIYFHLVSKFRLKFTLNEIFRWFFPYFVYPNIRIKLAKKDAYELNSRVELDKVAPFLDFLAGSVSYNELGRYIAYELMEEFKTKNLKPASFKMSTKLFRPPFIDSYEEIVQTYEPKRKTLVETSHR